MTSTTEKQTRLYTAICFIVVWLDTIARNYLRVKALWDAVVLVARSPSNPSSQRHSSYDSLRRQRQYRQPHPRRRQQRQLDYISQLPNELLQLILENTGTSTDWFHCTRVCQRWHQLVTPLLWKAPILSSPTDRLWRSMRLPKYGHAIQIIQRLDYSKQCRPLLASILKCCPNLTTLEVIGSPPPAEYPYLARCLPRMTNLILLDNDTLTDEALVMMAMQSRRHQFSALKRIDFVGCRKITHTGVRALLSQAPSLRQLNLTDCSRVSGQVLHHLSSGLQHLDVTRIGALMHTDIQALVTSCPSLVSLGLGRSRSLLLAHLQYRARMDEEAAPLPTPHRPLSRSRSSSPFYTKPPSSTTDALASLLDMLQQQRSHHQHSSEQVSSASVDLILSSLPLLKSLDLSHWPCLKEQRKPTVLETCR